MTTIATDGKSMAGDGLITSGDVVYGTAFQKVAKLSDGRLVGIAGSAFYHAPFCAWLENGGDVPDLGENFDALVLMPDGRCLAYDEKGRSIPEETPTASGSGRELAIGAMEAGASPEAAVKIAARRNTGTGGTITVLHLER